jgi:hypothetical protein
MLSGTVEIEGSNWEVAEELRAGPQSKLFTLTMVGSPQSRMHVRPLPGQSATTLDEVAALAADPAIRWFTDTSGIQWEARIVVHSEPNAADVLLVKFISDQHEVREVKYPFPDGLGRRTDEELQALLGSAE